VICSQNSKVDKSEESFGIASSSSSSDEGGGSSSNRDSEFLVKDFIFEHLASKGSLALGDHVKGENLYDGYLKENDGLYSIY